MLKVVKDLMVPIRWMDGQKREKGVVDAFRHSSMTTILMKRRSDERSDRNYSMADDQINEFEGTYGVEYDPYYDEPYATRSMNCQMIWRLWRIRYMGTEDTRRDRFSIATKAIMICIGGNVADLVLNSSVN